MILGNHKWKDYFSFSKISPVIRYLTLVDLFMVGGMGLFSPIFAIFIIDKIPGGTIELVGIAGMIFLLAQSLLQIPVAIIIDKRKGEKDDFWFLFSGMVTVSLAIFSFVFINNIVHLFILQFFYGLGMALSLPSWYAIFTRHIDKKHEGLEWGIYRTLIDLGLAGAAALGGVIALKFGFNVLFIIVSFLCLLAAFSLFGISDKIKKR